MLQSMGSQRVWHDWATSLSLFTYCRERTGTKELLDESERGEWKSWLKTQHSKTKIMASSPITSWQIDGETMETVRDYFWGASKSLQSDGDWSHEISHLLLGRKAMTNLDSILKNRHYFANKGPSSQTYGFSSTPVWMWELDYKESWVPKNWCLWTMVSEKTLESPLDCKEIKPVNPKGNQPWIFIGRTEALILWLLDIKSWLIGKDSDAEKDWR